VATPRKPKPTPKPAGRYVRPPLAPGPGRTRRPPLQPGRREGTGSGTKVTLGKVTGRRVVTDAKGNKITYTNESGRTWDYATKKFLPERTMMPGKSRTERTSMPKKAPRKRGY